MSGDSKHSTDIEIEYPLSSEWTAEIELMEQFQAGQRQTTAKLTPQRIQSAFEEIRALKAAPLSGDEMPKN